jgi:hypothetical protein
MKDKPLKKKKKQEKIKKKQKKKNRKNMKNYKFKALVQYRLNKKKMIIISTYEYSKV